MINFKVLTSTDCPAMTSHFMYNLFYFLRQHNKPDSFIATRQPRYNELNLSPRVHFGT